MKLLGFKGRSAKVNALARSRFANTQPYTLRLKDGSLVGVGETLVNSEGLRTHMLYGAMGTQCSLSDAIACGFVDQESL